jgi:hypothetical protein
MLIRCRQLNFDSERSFAATTSISAVNANSRIRCRQLNFSIKSQICCKQLNFSNECKFNSDNSIWQRKLIRCRQHHSAVKPNSLQTTQFGSENFFVAGNIIWQRNLTRCRQHNLAAKIPLLQITQIDIETNSLQAT